MNNLILKRN